MDMEVLKEIMKTKKLNYALKVQRFKLKNEILLTDYSLQRHCEPSSQKG